MKIDLHYGKKLYYSKHNINQEAIQSETYFSINKHSEYNKNTSHQHCLHLLAAE